MQNCVEASICALEMSLLSSISVLEVAFKLSSGEVLRKLGLRKKKEEKVFLLIKTFYQNKKNTLYVAPSVQRALTKYVNLIMRSLKLM